MRRELKVIKQNQKDKELVFITKKQVNLDQNSFRKVSGTNSAPTSSREETKMIEMQREEIKRLRKKMSELEGNYSIRQYKIKSVLLAVATMKPPKSPFSSQRLTIETLESSTP